MESYKLTGQETAKMLFQNLLAATALFGTAFAAPADEKRQDKKLQWFGINESGAEFGEKNFTGVYGKEYIWYDFKTIDQFIDQGMNMFRLNFCKTISPTGCKNEELIRFSDGASHTEQARWRLRSPLSRKFDRADQIHHSQGQVRDGAAAQLWSILW